MKRIFLVGVFSPEMRSVGDHAQLFALEKFLGDEFSDYEVVKMCRSDSELFVKLKRSVKRGDLIFISSSGDFGDKYCAISDWHDTRKKIVAYFTNNRVVQLPVSVCYLSAGNFEADKAFFCNKPHFTLLVRTPESADLLKSNFGCDVRFFPDFVFYLKPKISFYPRKGCLVVLRDDAESVFDVEDSFAKFMRFMAKMGIMGRAFNKLLKVFRYNFCSYKSSIVAKTVGKVCSPTFFDDVMTAKFDLTSQCRGMYLDDLFDLFCKFRVVVTDRFHAAVFAALTCTPCVALPTGISGKISGCSELLHQTLYANSLKEMSKQVLSAYKLNPTVRDYSSYFKSFRESILTSAFPQVVVKKECKTVLDAVKNRRSVRKFSGLPLSKNQISQLVEAGLYAPSAANMQATRLKVVVDPYLINAVLEFCSPWLKHSTPSALFVVCYNLVQPNKVGINMKRSDEPWKRFVWQDSSCVMQNMMLVAESLGLASCWASITPVQYGNQATQISKLLSLSPDLLVTSILLVGYPAQQVNYDAALHQGYKIKRCLEEFVLK